MIIAGLSTKYRPLPVVARVGVAFAGWTALEVAFDEFGDKTQLVTIGLAAQYGAPRRSGSARRSPSSR